LFWPLLAEKALPNQASTGTPATYWEIRFAFSEHLQGKWNPKRVLDKAIAVQLAPTQGLYERNLSASNFIFKAIDLDGRLLLQVLVRVTVANPKPATPEESWVVVHELAAAVEVSVCEGATHIGYPSVGYPSEVIATRPVYSLPDQYP